MIRFASTAVAAALAITGCPKSSPHSPADAASAKSTRPASGEFSVMTYNLNRFCYDDRDGDGQANDFKPDAEIQAEMTVIQDESPDVLACMEMGEASSFQRFRDELKKRGLDYPHVEHLVRPDIQTHLALLSRFPIVARLPITNESYTILRESIPVQHGFLCADIQVNDHYRFKIIAAHLKSKRFNEAGQTEMRRNEARLLNKNVRHFLADCTNQNLLVVGDLNDRPDSSALREAIGKQQRVLADLRPADFLGDTWTHMVKSEDTYDRTDYVLCSPAMLREAVTGKCHVVRSSLTSIASDHRPVVAVFRAQDL